MNNQFSSPNTERQMEPLAPPPQTALRNEAVEEERRGEATTPLINGGVRNPREVYGETARRLF